MADESSKPSRLLAWLQLMRLPNVFTAMADVAMGFLFTHEGASPLGVFTLLLLSSSCLYTGGMVLNDVCDLEQDRRERPHRPLPSGRVPLKFAPLLAFSLLILGMTAGTAVAWLANDSRSLVVVFALDLTIFFYNAALKSTFLGPVAMGACRFLNVLLGMSASPQPWSAANFIVAGGIGVYVTGITWFARREAVVSQRIQLVGGFLTLLTGMLMLQCFPLASTSDNLAPSFSMLKWILLFTPVVVLISWGFVRAILHPQPAYVQAAVKSGILAIIVLDAAIVFAVRGQLPAFGVLLLLVPGILLGRWVYST